MRVRAAPRDASRRVARATTRCALARAAYHLGNRHVPLQIGDGWLRYLHDHVLDDMVRGLGARGDASIGAASSRRRGAYARRTAHDHRTATVHDARARPSRTRDVH